MIYLDNCATTRPRQEVAEALAKSIMEDFSNPSSLHSLGLRTEQRLKEVRKGLASILRVKEGEVYFTSGATESNNIALQGVIRKNLKRGGRIISSPIEHPSVKNVIAQYRDDIEVDYLTVNDKGEISLDEFKSLLKEDTFLVSIMHVNNELGTIYPVEEMGRIIRGTKTRAVFHVDGTQGFMKVSLNLKDIDLYSASSHKIYGPKGVGLLYKDSSVNFNPMTYGGSQEGAIRPGTENINGILAFGRAVRLMEERSKEEFEHVSLIKKALLEGILSKVDGVHVNSPENSSPYILSLSFKGIRGETLLHLLEGDEIYISTSSACSGGVSHVVEELGLDKDYSFGTVRLCFSHENSLKDVPYILEKFVKYVKELRDI
ncbi:MAG: cysteine desulfurase [Tissierellia bacterium]|nr:cysteine desulfurase [Tissierellia bacterium]